MASNPPRALSDNLLSLTLTQAGQPVLTATVTVIVVSPSGTTTLASQSVPHVGGGIYQYVASPVVWPVDGTYTVTWDAVSGRTWHKVEPIFVSK